MSRRTRRKRQIYQAAEAQNLSFEARQEIFDNAYSQGFDKGFQKAQERFVEERKQIIVDTERQAMEKAKQKPFMALAHQNGYNEGYTVGYETGFQKGKLSIPKNHFTYKDLEHARQRGYDDGYVAGRAIVAGEQTSNMTRNNVLDEVLQECKVIAESNPNMAPGVNAVRHRVKKLRK